MKKQVIVIIVIAFAGGFLFSKFFSKTATTQAPQMEKIQKKEVYQCPMHPSVTSDHPGKCPICGMNLQRVDDGGSEKPHSPKILYYRNPMNPTVVSKTPAKDDMGMDYIPVYDEDEGAASDIPGRSGFNLSKERQQLIGVTSTKVTKRLLQSEIRANGSVAFDPDLFTAISEYRQALVGGQAVRDNQFSELKEDSDQLIEASRTRLKILGLTDSQITVLGKTKTDPMNLLLPKGHVWIYAEVYEYEVSGVKVGQEIEVSSPTIPGQIFLGKLSSVSPVINPTTRTVRVRGLVPDSQRALRPDSYVDVKIKSSFGERLAIPDDSVLHSGDRNFVFVVKGEGSFEPREVKVGIKTHDFDEILSGVQEGETVVTSAQFLIDSESRLRSAIQSLNPGGQSSPAPGPTLSGRMAVPAGMKGGEMK